VVTYSCFGPTRASKAIVRKECDKGRGRGGDPDIARSPNEHPIGDFNHRHIDTGIMQK
jgi:hypothetical protein